MRKLTNTEKEYREVTKILQKIKNLERFHSKDLIGRACFRYKKLNRERRKANELKKQSRKAKKKLR